jgi:hypothetical protein
MALAAGAVPAYCAVYYSSTAPPLLVTSVGPRYLQLPFLSDFKMKNFVSCVAVSRAQR